ncbi:DUF4232 domain-containing protein [Sphaerisporangium sp. NPDC088356]|uniref:DUF4232 domain-containing protein n=1 Tax=Sphaerisporangium sp. NPDC088356 TaxID=3154871 RepID=UPI00341609AD
MKPSNDARRLALVSAVVAGVVTVSAACGPASSVSSATSATSGQEPAAPARTAASVTGAATTGSAVASRGVRAAGSSAESAGSSVGSAGSAAGSAAARRCHTGSLAARVGAVGPGAGQRYAPLVLTNTSAKTCWVYGYVGLIMIDGRGDVLRTRTRRDGTPLRRITLRPGAGAYAKMHWTVVPTGRETRCPESARLIILPPDEVDAHLEIPFNAAPCDDGRIDVSPMAAGTHL